MTKEQIIQELAKWYKVKMLRWANIEVPRTDDHYLVQKRAYFKASRKVADLEEQLKSTF